MTFIQTAEHKGDKQNIYEASSEVNRGEVSHEPEGFLCTEGAVFLSKPPVSHRIKLLVPVNTEPKTISAKTDRLVLSGHLNSYYFRVSRIISFANKGYLSGTKSTRIN